MSLITQEDEKRVAQIAESTRPSEKDALWLCGMVHQLARVKPTEWDFPNYAALVHKQNCSAFALKFLTLITSEKAKNLKGPIDRDQHIKLLTYETDCPVCDAIVCVRPYIRRGTPKNRKSWSPKETAAYDRMAREATVSAYINEVWVNYDAPAEQYMVGVDGYGLRRKPANFIAPSAALQEGKLYAIGAMGWRHNVEDDLPYGLFLPNDTKIEISITNLQLKDGEELNLSTGLVMGQYTTRNSHLASSNPRAFGTPGTGAQS